LLIPMCRCAWKKKKRKSYNGSIKSITLVSCECYSEHYRQSKEATNYGTYDA
jgi:hypothetical protein